MEEKKSDEERLEMERMEREFRERERLDRLRREGIHDLAERDRGVVHIPDDEKKAHIINLGKSLIELRKRVAEKDDDAKNEALRILEEKDEEATRKLYEPFMEEFERIKKDREEYERREAIRREREEKMEFLDEYRDDDNPYFGDYYGMFPEEPEIVYMSPEPSPMPSPKIPSSPRLTGPSGTPVSLFRPSDSTKVPGLSLLSSSVPISEPEEKKGDDESKIEPGPTSTTEVENELRNNFAKLQNETKDFLTINYDKNQALIISTLLGDNILKLHNPVFRQNLIQEVNEDLINYPQLKEQANKMGIIQITEVPPNSQPEKNIINMYLNAGLDGLLNYRFNYDPRGSAILKPEDIKNLQIIEHFNQQAPDLLINDFVDQLIKNKPSGFEKPVENLIKQKESFEKVKNLFTEGLIDEDEFEYHIKSNLDSLDKIYSGDETYNFVKQNKNLKTMTEIKQFNNLLRAIDVFITPNKNNATGISIANKVKYTIEQIKDGKIDIPQAYKLLSATEPIKQSIIKKPDDEYEIKDADKYEVEYKTEMEDEAEPLTSETREDYSKYYKKVKQTGLFGMEGIELSNFKSLISNTNVYDVPSYVLKDINAELIANLPKNIERLKIKKNADLEAIQNVIQPIFNSIEKAGLKINLEFFPIIEDFKIQNKNLEEVKKHAEQVIDFTNELLKGLKISYDTKVNDEDEKQKRLQEDLDNIDKQTEEEKREEGDKINKFYNDLIKEAQVNFAFVPGLYKERKTDEQVASMKSKIKKNYTQKISEEKDPDTKKALEEERDKVMEEEEEKIKIAQDLIDYKQLLINENKEKEEKLLIKKMEDEINQRYAPLLKAETKNYLRARLEKDRDKEIGIEKLKIKEYIDKLDIEKFMDERAKKEEVDLESEKLEQYRKQEAMIVNKNKIAKEKIQKKYETKQTKKINKLLKNLASVPVRKTKQVSKIKPVYKIKPREVGEHKIIIRPKDYKKESAKIKKYAEHSLYASETRAHEPERGKSYYGQYTLEFKVSTDKDIADMLQDIKTKKGSLFVMDLKTGRLYPISTRDIFKPAVYIFHIEPENYGGSLVHGSLGFLPALNQIKRDEQTLFPFEFMRNGNDKILQKIHLLPRAKNNFDYTDELRHKIGGSIWGVVKSGLKSAGKEFGNYVVNETVNAAKDFGKQSVSEAKNFVNKEKYAAQNIYRINKNFYKDPSLGKFGKLVGNTLTNSGRIVSQPFLSTTRELANTSDFIGNVPGLNIAKFAVKYALPPVAIADSAIHAVRDIDDKKYLDGAINSIDAVLGTSMLKGNLDTGAKLLNTGLKIADVISDQKNH